ncbi:MAG TPA: site-2 protease family protein [Gaiellaceae bacterium]|nr:site-2 protease family protein [Gaiellaceae bacterium]
MRDSITIGRIAGITVGINWSWLIVFALIAWTLATAIFPDTNPGLGDGAYLTMALVAAVLFFSSLLAHEYGHALQARRDGMEIEGITLWLFGGVAKFKGMFPSAGAEFRIAIAGPAVSLVLGLVFLGLPMLLALPAAVDGVLFWLGSINLALLVFNLLPALPLDGGRILRAILWYVRGEFASATHLAALIGRGFGYVFVVGGVLALVFLNPVTGIWFAFIGWFLLQAAAAEDRFVAAQQALAGLRVRDVMTRDPVTTPADVTLGQFLDEIVWNRPYTTYPVTENGRTVGLLPFRRVAEVPRAEWDRRTVRDCMIPRESVPVVAADEELVAAAGDLSEHDVNRALVLDGERLVGLLSVTDVARALETRGYARRRA